MSNKWKSRKFWSAVVGALVLVANEGLDLGLDRDTIMAFTGLILGYIFVEGQVDKAREK